MRGSPLSLLVSRAVCVRSPSIPPVPFVSWRALLEEGFLASVHLDILYFKNALDNGMVLLGMVLLKM